MKGFFLKIYNLFNTNLSRGCIIILSKKGGEAQMFGYVVANMDRLEESQKELYRSYYCGLCRSLKKQFGNFGRLTLNYDMTFMVLLLADLYDPKTKVHEERCAPHPKKARKMAENEAIDYGAAMNLMLAYYNLVDDWEDEGSKRALMAAKQLKKFIPALEEQYPRQAKAIKASLKALQTIEVRNLKELDSAANAFGQMLGQIFAWRNDRWKEDCYRLGDALGHFIYWMDAYEDLPKDKKKKNYNPFIPYAEEEDFEKRVEEMLKGALGECALVLERLPLVEHLDLLRNILYSGVWSKYEQLRAKEDKGEKKE